MLDGSASDLLDLGLELGWDLFDVLGSDQDASPLVSLLLETSLRALTNRGRHDVDHVVGELRDVLAHADEQASGSHVVTHLDEALSQLVAVNEEQALGQLVRNAHVRVSDVLEGVEEDLVGVLVVTELLLLCRDVNSDLDGLTNVTNRSVELEGPLGLLGHVVSLTHQVVDQLVGERV